MKIKSEKLEINKSLYNKLNNLCMFSKDITLDVINGIVFKVLDTNICYLEPHRFVLRVKGYAIVLLCYDNLHLCLYDKENTVTVTMIKEIVEELKGCCNMAKQKLGMSSFDINKKFASEEEAYRYAKNLKQFIRQTCENNKNNGYIAQAIIGVSNTNGRLVSGVYNEQIGKKGRPKKVKDICTNEKVVELLGNLHTDWHIHILLVSKPSYTFRNKIKNYVDKNWFKIKQLYEEKSLILLNLIQ